MEEKEKKGISGLLKVLICLLTILIIVMVSGIYVVYEKIDKLSGQMEEIQMMGEEISEAFGERFDTMNTELSEISELCANANGLWEKVQEDLEQLEGWNIFRP